MFHSKLRLSILAAMALSTGTLFADSWTDRFEYRPEEDKFSDREWSVDVYTIWKVNQDVDVGDGYGGLGAGVNYFFNHYFGAGADTYVNQVEFPELINVSLIGRYPFEAVGTAPYIFIGGGRKYFGTSQWTGHVGGGLDYRLNRATGVFIDVRRTFSGKSRDYFLFRAGLKLIF